MRARRERTKSRRVAALGVIAARGDPGISDPDRQRGQAYFVDFTSVSSGSADSCR